MSVTTAISASDHRGAKRQATILLYLPQLLQTPPSLAEMTSRKFKELAPFSSPLLFCFFPFQELDIKDSRHSSE